jgi:cyclopropane fatty-acyl-phospholipid synthase-like methyltransferase
MDAIYSISVFTHLSEAMHFAWIKELKRVLKPGGLLLVTMHGNLSSHNLTQAELKEFRDGKLVVRANVEEGSRLYAAFHPDQFVSTQLLANFEVLRKVEPFAPFMRQTLWVVRNS